MRFFIKYHCVTQIKIKIHEEFHLKLFKRKNSPSGKSWAGEICDAGVWVKVDGIQNES